MAWENLLRESDSTSVSGNDTDAEGEKGCEGSVLRFRG